MSEPNAVCEVDELAQLEAELDAARRERDEFEAAQAKAKRTAQLRDELAKEKRSLAESKIIAELEEKHGALDKAIRRIDTQEGMVVVKKPNHLLFKKFQDSGKSDSEALYKLVRPCLVYPKNVSEFEAILEEEPATLTRCGDAVCFLAGVRRSDWEGK